MRYYTSDLHLSHPFIAALRGFYKPDNELTPEQIQLKHTVRNKLQERHANLNQIMRAIGETKFAEIVDTYRHDKYIIQHINAIVGKTDELIIAGDLSAGGIESLERALDLLDNLHVPPARRKLLLGNHEGFFMRNANAAMLATRFGEVSMTSYGMLGDKYPMIISHTPAKHRMTGKRFENMSGNMLSKRLQAHAPELPWYNSHLPNSLHMYHLHGHTHASNPNEFGSIFEINIGLDAWGLKPVSEATLINHIEESAKRVQARRKQTRCGSE